MQVHLPAVVLLSRCQVLGQAQVHCDASAKSHCSDCAHTLFPCTPFESGISSPRASMASSQRDVHASIVQAARQGGAGHKKLRAMASAAFSKYDVDGSGELNDLEVRQVVRDLTGQAPTSEQMHFLTRELDADADSVITRPEFIRW